MTSDYRFKDRIQAGQLLAAKLQPYAGRSDVVVVGLARGGVPVGREVAQVLAAPLEVMVVRKLGVPDQPELAMGAIAAGGIRVTDDELLRECGISARQLATITGACAGRVGAARAAVSAKPPTAGCAREARDPGG